MQDSHDAAMDETHTVAKTLDVATEAHRDDPHRKPILDWGADLVVVAHIEDPLDEIGSTRNPRFLIISPTAEAFEALATESLVIISLSIMVAREDLGMSTYSDLITEVISCSARSPSGRPLILLYTQRGVQFCVEDNRVFYMSRQTTHWAGKGRFKGAATDPTASA